MKLNTRIMALVAWLIVALVLSTPPAGQAAPAGQGAATVEYSIVSPGAPLPGLTFDQAAPWLGWAGHPIQALWSATTRQLTLYLPDRQGTSRCPIATQCVATPVTYRLVQGWTSVTVLSWPATVPWYLGFAGGKILYTVVGDELILQLGPQARP